MRPLTLFSRCLHANIKAQMAAYHFLFPGQGSQFVGMTKSLANLPSVQEVFSTASKVLGYDLQRLCLLGPQASLDETVHCQPAVMVASLVAVEGLKQTAPEVNVYDYSPTATIRDYFLLYVS